MGTPRENMAEVEAQRARLREHPMALRIIETDADLTVIYPSGDFRRDGVRVSFQIGKAAAMRRILDVMESDWMASYP